MLRLNAQQPNDSYRRCSVTCRTSQSDMTGGNEPETFSTPSQRPARASAGVNFTSASLQLEGDSYMTSSDRKWCIAVTKALSEFQQSFREYSQLVSESRRLAQSPDSRRTDPSVSPSH